MLGMTEAFGAYLSRVLSSKRKPGANCVRLVLKGGVYRLDLDAEKSGDKTYSHGGKVVLVVDEQLATALEGRTIDIEDTPAGPGLSVV